MDGETLRQALINQSSITIKNWRIGEKTFAKIDAIIYKKARKPRADHQIDVAVRVIEDSTRTVFECGVNDVYLTDKEVSDNA